MQRVFTGRRVATVAVSSALAISTFGGSAWAAPNGTGVGQHTLAADPTLASVQPASTADFSGNGANVHGPYDSTRHGQASANGNGSGPAYGKPCAGCVGKADNKNPKGQMPGGSDHNAGYECDRNAGVGQGNPAHTGCTTAPVVTPAVTPVVAPVVAPAVGSADSPASVEGEKVVKPVKSGSSAVEPATVGGVGSAKAADAGVQVLGEHVTRAPGVSVEAASATRLPFTGAAHTKDLVLIALLLMSIGGGLMVGGRRRTTA